MKLKKIGILGGTLDPIHLGHLIIAQYAMEELGLEKVLFMPSGNPPHKNISDIVSAAYRKDMINLAIKDNDNFLFSDFELKRQGTIYTSDTLKMFLDKNKNTEIYFIMGADSVLSIETWHEPDKIFKLCKVVVADRDYNLELLKKQKIYLEEKYRADIILINSPLISISSTDIRNRIKSNHSIRYLVPDEVKYYIEKNELYL